MNLPNLPTIPALTAPAFKVSLSRLVAAALLTLGLVGCAIPEAGDRTAGWTAEQLYAEAKEDMEVARYEDAIVLLQILEARYPFGRYAQQAKIDIAYSYYKDDQRGMALAAIDRFIKLHPNHAKLDYLYYLKGLTNYNQRDGLLNRLGGQDLSERDLDAARESFDAFRTVVTRFPNSSYVTDARQRMRFLVSSMAEGEVSVARFYYQRGAYIAAANRAQEVVRKYQQVPAVEQALFILMRSYERLGLEDLGDGTKRVLLKNFPESKLEEARLAEEQAGWWQVWR